MRTTFRLKSARGHRRGWPRLRFNGPEAGHWDQSNAATTTGRLRFVLELTGSLSRRHTSARGVGAYRAVAANQQFGSMPACREASRAAVSQAAQERSRDIDVKRIPPIDAADKGRFSCAA
jgi:hypothetical protein